MVTCNPNYDNGSANDDDHDDHDHHDDHNHNDHSASCHYSSDVGSANFQHRYW